MHTQSMHTCRFKQLRLLKVKQINRYLMGMFQNYFTRRHNVHDLYTRAFGSLSVQCTRTDYRKFLQFCKVPITWNKIPSYAMCLRLLCLRSHSRITSYHRMRYRLDFALINMCFTYLLLHVSVILSLPNQY